MDSILYRLSSTPPPGEVSLRPEAWRVLTQIDGSRSLAQIAQILGMQPTIVDEIAKSLHGVGMLEIVSGNGSAAPTNVDSSFFEFATRELARAMGPLAEFVLDDEIANLGETRDRFPSERLPELVEAVSNAVRDETRRLRFQQIMLEAMRKS